MIDSTKNYFELFNIEPAFDIELGLLTERYKAMQSAVHPDRYASASDQEKRLAVQVSSMINQAYDTLRNPMQRAEYLLSLLTQQNGSAGEQSMFDREFLEKQLELREAIQEIKASQDMEREQSLRELIHRDIQATQQQLFSLFKMPGVKNLVEIKHRIQKWHFYRKLESELDEIRDV